MSEVAATRPWAWLMIAGLVLAPGVARAQDATAAHATDTPSAGTAGATSDTASNTASAMKPGVLPALGALVPGVAVHGTGHWIGGDGATARKLLRLEGLGLGLVVTGGLPLALTGAARRLALPTIPLLLSGGGLLLAGWAGDVYGAAGGPRIAGAPRLVLPGLEARLGYLHVHDPQFAYGSFLQAGARLRRGAWRGDGDVAVALDDDSQRLRLEAGRRLYGPRPEGAGPRAADGTRVDVDAALMMHRHGTEGFTVLTGEVIMAGRYDMARLGPSLRGAFAELHLGLGLEVSVYEGDAVDVADLLLGGFGFGMYLGAPAAAHGEVRVFYEHRRDDLAGGLAMSGGGNGFLGSFGVDGFVAWGPRWGVGFRAEVGSAYVGSAGLRYRIP